MATEGTWAEAASGSRRALDVRSRGDYEDGHLAGSVWIPADEVERRLYELPETAIPLLVVAASRDAANEVLSRLGGRCKWVGVGVGWEECCSQDVVLVDRGFDSQAKLWRPTPILVEWVERLEGMLGGPGSMADIGCGHGRDMAFLTARGWQVSGVDNRAVLLDHAVHLCSRYGGAYADKHKPTTLAADLRKAFPLAPLSTDLVVVVRFLLRDTLESIRACVRPGGFILYSHFLEGCHLVGPKTPKTPSHYFARGELEEIFSADEFDVVLSQESKLSDERPIIDFIARRKTPKTALHEATPASPQVPPGACSSAPRSPADDDTPSVPIGAKRKFGEA
eukprot:TRINITY_DN8690_c0_g3_i1.p1 TRINITY_DN8690_c0_g3~~TRINITY_DN8690_c0_g3_i1.p1  ORF type:complete len:337 (+),score=44.85 TRINITY_DN8690_c0_g3_i1:91-1101(+)